MKISSRTALLCTLLIGFSLATRHLAAQSTSEATIVLPDADSAEPKTAEAAETTVDADTGEEIYILSDFEVSVEKDRGYHSAHSLAATRTNALIKDTPVNITVINKQLMEDLSIVNPNDLEKVVASAYKEDHANNNRIRFRGFRTNFQLYEFMPRQSGLNWYNIERSDIIRGSNSLIYGQSAPGGKVNFNAKRASFGRDRSRFTYRFGSEDLRSLNYDLNKVVNDEIAVRVMGAEDSKQSYKRYAERELSSQTIEVTYRPSRNTEFRLHSEFSQSFANWVPGTYVDGTTVAGLSGILDGLPATPEIVDFLSNDILQYIYGYADPNYFYPDPHDRTKLKSSLPYNSNSLTDSLGPPPLIDLKSKQDIRDFYAGITPENSGSLAYSDAGNESDSEFHLFDATHQFSDRLNYKFSILHETIENLGLRPEGGNVLRASLPWGATTEVESEVGGVGADPHDRIFVNPYWVRTNGSDKTTALRNTLSWQFENDLLFANSKYQLLFGLDYDKRDNNVRTEQLYYVNRELQGGRYAWAQRGADYYPIDYTGANPVDLKTNEYFDDNTTGYTDRTYPWPDFKENGDLTWADRSLRLGSTETKSAWLALQGKHLKNRLNTLIGVRFDDIDVASEISSFQSRPFGFDVDQPGFVERSTEGNYKEYSPSIGALYWLTPNLGLFANYAESIETPTGWELQPDGEDIPPQMGSGSEVGFKFEFMDGKLNGQVLAFEVEKVNDSTKYSQEVAAFWAAEQPASKNLLEEFTSPQGDQQYRLIHAGRHIGGTTVESEGVEADIYYNPTDSLSLMLGYAYMDAEIQNSPVLGEMDRGIIDGDPYPGFAHHNGVFTARYNFKNGPLKGWYVGMNQRYRSKTFLGTFYEDVGTTDLIRFERNSTEFLDGKPDVIDVREWSDGLYNWYAIANVPGTTWYDNTQPDFSSIPAPNREASDEAFTMGMATSQHLWGDDPANGGNGNGILEYEERTITDANGNRVSAQGNVVKARSHRVWLSDHFSTTVFFGWGGQLPGMKGRGAPRFNVHVAFDNLFDAVDLIAKGNGQAGFTSPRSWSIRASVNF
ncbi:MAG: TonB-dependent siderophore receptor [Opitutales bacterium]